MIKLNSEKKRPGDYALRKNLTIFIDNLLLVDRGQKIITHIIFSENKKNIVIDNYIKKIFTEKNIPVSKDTIDTINESFSMLGVNFLLKDKKSYQIKETDIYKNDKKNSEAIAIEKIGYKLQTRDCFNFQFDKKISMQSFFRIQDWKII